MNKPTAFVVPKTPVNMSKRAKKELETKGFIPPITVESGIPAPTTRSMKHPYFQALYEMKEGDSFALPLQFKRQIQRAVAWCKRTTGKKFTTKADATSVRVWRLPDDSKE